MSGEPHIFLTLYAQRTCTDTFVYMQVENKICTTICPPHAETKKNLLLSLINTTGRSQWPRGLRRRSAAARLLRWWVRIPPGAWMSVCCECCVLSGRGFCVGLIARPEESHRLWCVVECDLANLLNEEAMAHWGGGCCAKNKQTNTQTNAIKA